MKKFVVILLACMFVFSISVSAASDTNGANVIGNVEYFDDGSYIVTSLEYISDDSNTQTRAAGDYTVSGKKSATYYNGDDEIIWQVTVTGVFLIVPTNANMSGYCQSSKLSYVINSSSWHISNIVENEITNNAVISCTMKRKLLGITTKTVDVDLHITCDSYGNLS